MDAERGAMDELLDSVSEGRAVDWAGAEAAAHGTDDQARVRGLRVVSAIAEFHRERQRADAGGQGADPLAPMQWGELLLLERVGAGSSGAVWRAWDPRLQRDVALKLLTADAPEPDAAESPLLREARALASVRHPHVVVVHGIEEHEGRVGVSMEFLRGASLAAEIERRGALPVETVRTLGIQLGRALDALHAAGLVHRDIKPANVVMEADGRAVLTDLGLGLRNALERPEQGGFSGTPMFMAPELLEGGAATVRSDLYALGVLMRWAITGRAPFAAATLAELRAEAPVGPARPLLADRGDVPVGLARVIERAMSPEASARFANAGELVAALEDATRPGPVSHFGRGLIAVGAAIAIVAAGAWFNARSRAPHAPPRPATDAAPGSIATVPYDVDAALVRHDPQGATRLANGDRVKPGDRLSLEFHASRPAWLYVIEEDERGESYLLFPQPMFDQRNPIAPGAPSELPGTAAGRAQAWTVTSRGGREHFLIVASPAPLAELESELSRIPAAEPGRPIVYARVPASVSEQLRGVGGVAPLPPGETPRSAGSIDRIAALAGRERGVSGVWVRRVTLENPVR